MRRAAMTPQHDGMTKRPVILSVSRSAAIRRGPLAPCSGCGRVTRGTVCRGCERRG